MATEDSPTRDQPRANFSDLVGLWIPDPGFDEIIAAQRQIDWAEWNRELYST